MTDDRKTGIADLLAELSTEQACLGTYEVGMSVHDGSPRTVRAAARIREIEAELQRRGIIQPAMVRRTGLRDAVTGEHLGTVGALDHDPERDERVACFICGDEASMPKSAVPADAPRLADGRVSAICPRCLRSAEQSR